MVNSNFACLINLKMHNKVDWFIVQKQVYRFVIQLFIKK